MKHCVLALLLLASGVLRAEVKVNRQDFKPDEESRKIYWAQPIRFWGGKYINDPAMRFSLLTLSNAKTSFVFYINGKLDGERWPAAIGMARPSEANWYINSFFTFNIDKITPAECHVEIVEVPGDGSSGSFILRYSHPKLQAELKLTLLDDDDKLLMEFTPAKIDSAASGYMVRLLCYPSSLAGGSEPGRALRKREARTPARTLNEARHTLTPEDYWILFYDNYFDVRENRGDGPCALLFNPTQTIRSECSIANYGCQTFLYYPMAQSASFVLWDLKGWSNQAAIEFMNALKVKF